MSMHDTTINFKVISLNSSTALISCLSLQKFSLLRAEKSKVKITQHCNGPSKQVLLLEHTVHKSKSWHFITS